MQNVLPGSLEGVGCEFFSLFSGIFGVLGKCDALSGPDFAAEAKSWLPLTSVRGCHNTALDLTFFIHY